MISAPVFPSVLVYGLVVKIVQRFEYDREAQRRTDKVSGYEVTIQGEDGGQVNVRYRLEDPQVAVASYCAVLANVQESREYGTFLNFGRDVTPGDLDKINSALSIPAKG